MSEPINPVWCTHRETTPGDADGRMLCCRCGATVAAPGPWTARMVHDTMQRQPHTSDCVRVDGRWVCARRCSEYRRTER